MRRKVKKKVVGTMDNECIMHPAGGGEDFELKEEWKGKSLFLHKVLVGIGEEWAVPEGEDGTGENKARADRVKEGYEALSRLLEGKDYFIITMNTDGKIFESSLDEKRITAPCGNIHWFQCENACTKDIWEEGEVENGLCPHCGAHLISNTVDADKYIEEGYLPRWNDYRQWLSGTINRKMTVLELGVGFKHPGVIRWPFEKIVFYNNKANMYRVHQKFFQVSEELKEKAEGIQKDSVEFIVDSPKLW